MCTGLGCCSKTRQLGTFLACDDVDTNIYLFNGDYTIEIDFNGTSILHDITIENNDPLVLKKEWLNEEYQHRFRITQDDFVIYVDTYDCFTLIITDTMKGLILKTASGCSDVDLPVSGKKTLFITDDCSLGIKNPDGECVSINGYTSKTYAELKALFDAGKLVAGTWYLITDFKTIHLMPETAVRNDANLAVVAEPLIVSALSNDTLDLQAFSLTNPLDIIHYDIDNASWGALVDAGSTGMITYREDTVKNISMPQDFRAVGFRRWGVDLSAFAGPVDVDCLWNEADTVGKDDSTGWDDQNALVALDSGNFTDHFTFGDYANSGDVQIRGTLGTVLVNLVVIGTANLLDVYNVNDCHFGGDVRGIVAERMDKVLSVANAKQVTDVETVVFGLFDSVRVESHESVLAVLTFFAARVEKGLVVVTLFAADALFKALNVSYLYQLVRTSMSMVATGAANNGRFTKLYCGFMVFLKLEVGLVSQLYGTDPVDFDGSFPFTVIKYDFTAGQKLLSYDVDKRTSTIEASIVAAAAIVISKTTGDFFAGEITLTGAAPISIATVNPNKDNDPVAHKIMFKPVAGLVIDIAFNDVNNGFLNKATITADGDNGEVIWIEEVGNGRWRAYQ